MGFAVVLRIALDRIGGAGVISESQAPMNWDDHYTVYRAARKNTPDSSFSLDAK